MDMPERLWAWNFIPSKQDDVMKGGWDDAPDRKAVEYIRADLVPQWQPDAILRTTPETLDETTTRDMMPARYRRAEGETE